MTQIKKALSKKFKCLYQSTLGSKLLKNVKKKITDVSSSRDFGGNRMVTLGCYGKLIKEKNSIRIFFH